MVETESPLQHVRHKFTRVSEKYFRATDKGLIWILNDIYLHLQHIFTLKTDILFLEITYLKGKYWD